MRLLVLSVRGQRDAEARDRVKILTARDLDHPPQAVDRAGRVARALEQRGEPAVRIRMIGIRGEDRGPVIGGLVVQAQLFVGAGRQRVQIIIARMFAQALRRETQRLLVVAGRQK